jgi:rhodanese-related sulfurtransferase
VSVPEIDVEALEGKLAEGVPLIDVRQPEEYTEAHVPGAVLLPLGEVPARFDEVPRDRGAVYVICRSGARSLQAATFLQEQGFDVVNVTGGTLAWLASGREHRTGEQPG